MVCGFLPFEEKNTKKLYAKILSGELNFPAYLSNNMRDLLTCVLNIDPARRYDINAIRQHAWIT
jgi:serine/threonine protein kinase